VNLAPTLLLLVVSFGGAVFYFGLAKVFRLEAFDYIVKTIKEYKKGRLKK
jgi:hypothetical protein